MFSSVLLVRLVLNCLVLTFSIFFNKVFILEQFQFLLLTSHISMAHLLQQMNHEDTLPIKS